MATGGRYTIQLKPSVLASLRLVPERDRKRIGRKISALADNPRPRGVEKLEGEKDAYRIRSGDYRILYRIEDRLLTVQIVRVDNRKDVYRNLGDL